MDPDEIDAYSPAASRMLNAVARRPSRRTRRLVIVAVALLAVVAALAMVWVFATRDVNALSTSCYQEISLASDRIGIEVDSLPSATDCEQPWEEGILKQPGLEPGTVPNLTACVTDTGELAVFPSEDPETCSALGLATPTPDQPQDTLTAVAAAQADIRDYLFGSACRFLDEAELEIRLILDRSGLTDWSIRRQPDQPNRPCASVIYDVPGTTVIVVPIPSA